MMLMIQWSDDGLCFNRVPDVYCRDNIEKLVIHLCLIPAVSILTSILTLNPFLTFNPNPNLAVSSRTLP